MTMSPDLDVMNTYRVEANDPHLATALTANLESARWRLAAASDVEAFVVTDDLTKSGERVVVVVDDAPGSCQFVLQALAAGRIAAAVSRFELDRLPIILEAALLDVVGVPIRVVKASSELPRLGQRQREVLDLLATGLSNTEIANRMHVSQATVKREVSHLLQVFEATNRLELAMRGAEAGLIDTVRVDRSPIN